MPVAWITWLCTDGVLVPPANGPLALFSPQLDPLRNRFHHFDSCMCVRSVCSLMWLPLTGSRLQASPAPSAIRLLVLCSLDPHLAIHLSVSSSPQALPFIRLPSFHSLFPSLHRPSIVLALLFFPPHPSPPPLSSTPGWILPWCVSTAHLFLPSPLSHLHLILLSFPSVLPSPPNTTPVCPFISPRLTVLFLTSASLTHTHPTTRSRLCPHSNSLVHYLDVPISGRLPFVTLAPPPSQ